MNEDARIRQEKADMDRIEVAARHLGEHYDSVQIFAHRHDPQEMGGTVFCDAGVGSFFSRYGQVKCWTRKIENKEGCE
jgi:hypothetical protein